MSLIGEYLNSVTLQNKNPTLAVEPHKTLKKQEIEKKKKKSRSLFLKSNGVLLYIIITIAINNSTI